MRAIGYARARPFGGASYLTGTTVVAGAPDSPAPLRRIHVLTTDVWPRLVRAPVSDAGGAWLIEAITARWQYTVVAYDDAGVHDPVAKANLVPTPMAPDPAEHA